MKKQGGKMQILICDDDKRCCAQIEKWLIDYKKRENINIHIDICYSAENVIKRLDEGYWFDLIFLEIEFSRTNGIELGHKIRECYPDKEISIVFISEKKCYYEELFALEPQNFHCKPLIREDIFSDVEKVIKRNGYHKNVLKYYCDGIPKGILIRDILFIKSKGNEIVITKKDNSKVVVRGSLSKIEKDVKKHHICKCHRSFLVNLCHVNKYFNQTFFMENGYEIPIGRTYTEYVKKMWAEYENDIF